MCQGGSDGYAVLLCDFLRTPYTAAAGESCDSIVAIGFANDTQDAYAWYADGTYSHGDSTKLDQYSHGVLKFTNQTSFSMNQLVDVDNSDNREWYYYWKDVNGRIWRTVGTSDHSSNGSGNGSNPNGVELAINHVQDANSLWGISFAAVGSGPRPILAWYGSGISGTVDRSSDSTNLNQ
jgi:hypothetical protein